MEPDVWRCNECQETVEDDFEVCWNCCAVRPGIEETEEAVSPSDDTAESDLGLEDRFPIEVTDNFLRKWQTRFSRAAAMVSRLPCVVIALLLQITFWLLPTHTADVSWSYSPGIVSFALFGVALFIPRAIQQQDWKGLAAMAAFGAVVPFVLSWAIVTLPIRDSLIIHRLAWPLGLIILAGTAEWLRSPSDSWWSFVCVMVVGTGVAFAYGLVSYLIDVVPSLSTPAPYLNSALLVMAVWLSIPLGFWIAEPQRRAWQVVSGLGFVSSAVCYFWTMSSGVYLLAEQSLQLGGPFDQEYSVGLLAHRGRESDFRLISSQLDQADWNARFAYPPNQFDSSRDWRYRAVSALIQHNESSAADRLSKLLLAKPSRQLIDMTDGLFVRQRRYETVPIYLRYAEVESMDLSPFATVGQDRFKLALEEFRVPQVVHAWMRDTICTQVFFALMRAREVGRDHNFSVDEIVVKKPLREKLRIFLGKDAGDYYLDWSKLYQEEIQTAPSPLSNSVRHEADRVIECFEEYDGANARLADARTSAEKNDWTSPARPDPPNWDIPTTDGLQREIDDYAQRVEKAIEVASPH